MLDFYVYLHRRKDNNQVFYVGKGRLDRHKRSRAYKTWKSVVDERKHTASLATWFT